ncbi:Adenylate kinase 2, partial [Coemansia nantahalensis]
MTLGVVHLALRGARRQQHARVAGARARSYQGAASSASAAEAGLDPQLSQSPSPLRSLTRSGVPLRMLILGAPGAGKGTQSARVRQCFDVAAISSGDVLRRNIAAQTAAGRMAQAAVERGALVSDDIV